MSKDFGAMKKGGNADFERLSKEAEKLDAGKFQQDDRFWEPTRDKAGNGTAIIRFLPSPQNEDYPFIRYWDHFFKGPGGWYINKSLTTIGKDDPVSEYNSRLWDTGVEANKNIARKQKRKLHYVSNIYVVSDPSNPDSEGKVFLFNYGKQIFDKIKTAMHPEFDDETPFDPFNFWKGANFKLRVRNVDDYPNYESSLWEDPSPLLDDDDAMEAIWKQEFSLQEFIDPSTFKTYEELSARLKKVLGQKSGGDTAETVEVTQDEDEEDIYTPPSEDVASGPSIEADDDDEALAAFKTFADSA